MQLARIIPKKVSAAELGLAARNKGLALEDRVVALLKASGKKNVRKNVLLWDGNGNRSEIDVVYGRWIPTYVECKAYGPDKSVPLEDVSKFKDVLALNKVLFPRWRALFVTTSTYSPRARTVGMRCIDGKELAAWEQRVRRKLQLSRMAQTFISGVLSALLLWFLAVSQADNLPMLLGQEQREVQRGSVVHALQEQKEDIQEGWKRGCRAPAPSVALPSLPRPGGGSGGSWVWGTKASQPAPPLPPSTTRSAREYMATSSLWPAWLESLLGRSLGPPPDMAAHPLGRMAYEGARLATCAQGQVGRAKAWLQKGGAPSS